MKREITIFFKILVFSLLSCNFAYADTPLSTTVYKKIKLNGKRFRTEATRDTKKVVFYGVSKGNQTKSAEVTVRGPQGMSYKVKVMRFKGSVDRALRKPNKKFYDLDIYSASEWSNRHSECREIAVPEEETDLLEFDPENYPPTWNAWCEALGVELLQEITNVFNEYFHPGWTIHHACSYVTEGLGVECDQLSCEECHISDQVKDIITAYLGYLPGSEDDPNGPSDECEEDADGEEEGGDGDSRSRFRMNTQFERGYGLFRKDSCEAASTKYLVKVIVDLKNVRPKSLREFVPLQINFKINEDQDSKEAALKPESEGRFAPRPIVIMNWLGDSCGANIDVVRWNKGKPVQETRLDLYTYLLYRGYTMALALVDPALHGGEASVDHTDTRSSYGVCMQMERRRQNFNNYPTG